MTISRGTVILIHDTMQIEGAQLLTRLNLVGGCGTMDKCIVHEVGQVPEGALDVVATCGGDDGFDTPRRLPRVERNT